MAQIPELKIENGPNKFDLMVSLFDCRRRVKFSIQNVKGQLDVAITGVDRGSDWACSGENWAFRGYLLDCPVQIAGSYSTADRKGTFTFVPAKVVRGDPYKPEPDALQIEQVFSYLNRIYKR